MFIMTKLGGVGWGGAHKVSVMLANYLAQNGYDVSFAVSERSRVDYPLEPSIKVFCLTDFYKASNKRTLNLWRKMKAFRALCKKEKIDLLVGFTSNMAIYTILATLGSKRKALISERTDPEREPRKKWLRGIRNVLFCFADKAVFQTPGARDYYPRIVRKKSQVIPNPISGTLPEAYGGVRERRVVNFCRIDPQKNLIVLLEAFDLFAKERPEYTLDIYGDAKENDAYARSVYQFADAMACRDRVTFYPACSDVHQKVLKAKIFASSSDYEGISNSMLEALAIGLPTIVTDCKNGGERMCVETGKNGIIVPRRDPKALAEAMAKIADDEETANELSKNAVKIRERFSVEKIFAMWKNVVDEMTVEKK